MISKEDFIILNELQKNGRASYSKLSKITGIPSSTIYDRVNRLISSEVIMGFSILVDKKKIGLSNIAIIGIETGAKKFREVAKNLCEIRDVVEVYGTTADFDLMIKVLASSREELSKVLNQIRSIDGIDDIYVSSILEVFKESYILPFKVIDDK